MAKKIIEQGSTTFRVRCGQCNTKFAYEFVDVRPNYVYGGDWVCCPHCGARSLHVGQSGARDGCCS